jgi:glycosyltransferase involved in cell wall biosynthesis
MRFSILIPTRSRLSLLRYAVQSVLDQEFEDWEIVISDNVSDDDIGGFVEEIGDPRITCLRTESLLPVTENWNNALNHSSGDYVIMLGDDDCLMRDCLSSADKLISDHGEPDLLFADAIQFYYPGVMPGTDRAHVQFAPSDFLNGQREPFWLSRECAREMVVESLRFRVSFMYNMQYSVISRRMVARLREKGAFFQSPYPDYYASNALFLTAETILVSPRPIVAIGVSPKSFGFYYFNRREDEGVEFLQNIAEERLVARVRDVMLPGTDMNNSWLAAMEALVLNYGDDYDLRLVVRNYRFIQLRALFSQLRPIRLFVSAVWEHGTWGERLFWYAFLAYGALAKLMGPRRAGEAIERTLDAIHVSHPSPTDSRRKTVPYANILEMARAEDADALMVGGP